jgi:hypothetical protein
VNSLPQGVKLRSTGIGGSYSVILSGVELGSVRPESRSYHMRPKSFVMRWWQAKLLGSAHPLGVTDERTAQGWSLRDQVTHFNTRQDAVLALIAASAP